MPHQNTASRLVVENLAMVQHIVSRLSSRYPRHVDRNDLWNAGALGLVEAAGRFDETLGMPFARYAAIRVRGAIIDSTRSRDWATRAIRHDLRAIHETEEELRGRGLSADDQMVATALDMTIDELRKRRYEEVSSTLLYLDHEGDEPGTTLRDTVVDRNSAARPDTALETKEVLGALAESLGALAQPQKEVITRYYVDGELMQDIAADMGVTEARISQIRTEALASMRSFFSTLYEEVKASDSDVPGKRARARYLEAMEASTWRSRLATADSRVVS